jgi:glycosyltransferase involved in cell wall biosynthesis
LPEAIESALSQTHRPIEVIVVDDGSPDNTAEVVACYPQIRYVRQENRGLGGARNSGFRVSKGEYILFLDADDRFMADAAAAHLSCFANHPEAGFVVGDIDNIALDGSYLGSPRFPLLEGSVYEDVLKVNHVANTIAVMFRRLVIERVGGFKMAYSPSEDIELLLSAARLFPSVHHRTTVAQYRRYANTLTCKGTVMLPAILRVMRLQDDVVKGEPELLRARRQGVAYWCDYFGRPALKQINTHLQRGEMMRAVKTAAALLAYTRGRVLLMPFKYRRRILSKIWPRRISARRNRSAGNAEDSPPSE